MRAKRGSRVNQGSREHLRFVCELWGAVDGIVEDIAEKLENEQDGRTDVGDSKSNDDCVSSLLCKVVDSPTVGGGMSASLHPRVSLSQSRSDKSIMESFNLKYDYDTYAYLAITLTPSSAVLADPSRVYPHLKHLGPVCQLFLPHLIRSRSSNAGRPEHCPTSMCSRCQSERGSTHPQPSSRYCVRQTVF